MAPVGGARSIDDIRQLRSPDGYTANDIVKTYNVAWQDFRMTHGRMPYMTFDLHGVEEIDQEVMARIGEKAKRIAEKHGRMQLVGVGEPIYHDVMASRVDGHRFFDYAPSGKWPNEAYMPEVYTDRIPEEIQDVLGVVSGKIRKWGFQPHVGSIVDSAVRVSGGVYGILHTEEAPNPEFALLRAFRMLTRADPDFDKFHYNAADYAEL